MEIQCGRELIKKSLHMATLCKNCPDLTQEKRIWQMACRYIQQARDFLPPAVWSQLTPLEIQILQSGVPQPIQLTFFDDTDDNSVFPPVPSSWEDITLLQKQIRELECEKEKLTAYQELTQRLREENIAMERAHAQYKDRAQHEQTALHTEIKRMKTELATIPDLQQDAFVMEQKFKQVREYVNKICKSHREEMGRMYSELDAVVSERESLAGRLQTTQESVLLLTSRVHDLESNIERYQDISQTLVSLLSEEQKDQMTHMLAERL